jgi:hypothetical protein
MQSKSGQIHVLDTARSIESRENVSQFHNMFCEDTSRVIFVVQASQAPPNRPDQYPYVFTFL